MSRSALRGEQSDGHRALLHALGLVILEVPDLEDQVRLGQRRLGIQDDLGARGLVVGVEEVAALPGSGFDL